MLEVEPEDDLARELLCLELLELRVPVVRVGAPDDEVAAAPRLEDVGLPLLDLDGRLRLVDRGQAVHLDGDQARDDDHQAEDEPLALEHDGEVLAQVRRLVRGGGGGCGLREVAQRAVERLRGQWQQAVVLHHNSSTSLLRRRNKFR